MKPLLIFWMISVCFVIAGQDALPKVSSGKLVRLTNFPSIYVDSRHVDIWLPKEYDGHKKFAVLYMQDGQMLYDSTTTWNQQAWDVDDVAGPLMASKKFKNFIVVGIWNGGQSRHKDYFPQKPFESLTKSEKDSITNQLIKVGRIKESFKPQSDLYLKFITEELKPYIDKTYAVYPNPKNTFIAGSSMGGLISIYGICEYPHIFGGAACFSTHWPGTFQLENNPFPKAMVKYLLKNLPKKTNHKIYFDCGDQTLDALYPRIQQEVDSVMRSKGYTEKNWLTVHVEGGDHSERAWKKRLYKPLQFLFLKNK